MTYSHPVFGPNRQSAALAAISELAQAQHALTGWADYDTPTLWARRVKSVTPS